MQTLKLVIGSKNSSSWSLRPWLLLKQIGVPFEELLIPLQRPETAEMIRAVSPSGKVPALIMGDVRIWDSLAICEFLAEHDPSLWPADSRARAIARSVSAEMHSGFVALRAFLPLDFTARFGPPGRLLSPVQADLERILAIWNDCRRQNAGGGPFLFGPFTIADAMFAPVCSRLVTYAVPVHGVAATYVETMMGLPAMQEWARGAAAEVAGRPEAASAARLAQAATTAAAARTLAPEPARPRPSEPERLPSSFAPQLVLAEPDAEPAPVQAPAPPPALAIPVAPTAPPVERHTPSPHAAPEDIRRALRPIPSTVMIKPIGDHSQRRKP